MKGLTAGQNILIRQVDSLWGKTDDEGIMLDSVKSKVEDRLEKCFTHLKNKYYSNMEFQPYHSCQYAYLLYFFSNELYKKYGDTELSNKIYCTLKMCSGMDLFYQINMPEVFFFDHPVGTVMGRAQYGNKFHFVQNCTVGNNNGIFPVIGENVTMMSGSKILGDCKIGNNVVLAANCYVLDMDIPDNSIVYGQNPRELHIVTNKKRVDEITYTYYEDII